MGRWIDIKANDIFELVGESGVVGDLERAHPMRLKPLSGPDAPHRGWTDPHRLGHCWRAPVGRLVGRRLVGQCDDPIDGLGWQRRNARGPGLVAGQSLDPFMHEALLPAPDHGFALADSAGDGGGARAVSGQNNDPRAPDVLLRAVAIANVSSRTRSSTVTVMEIPLRITDYRTKPSLQKLLFGLFCRVLSTSSS